MGSKGHGAGTSKPKPPASTKSPAVTPPKAPVAPQWTAAGDWKLGERTGYLGSPDYLYMDRWLDQGGCQADTATCVQRFLAWYTFIAFGAADPLGTLMASGCEGGDFVCGMAMGNLRVGAGVAWGGAKAGAGAVVKGAPGAVGTAMVEFGNVTGLSTRPAAVRYASEAGGGGGGVPWTPPKGTLIGPRAVDNAAARFGVDRRSLGNLIEELKGSMGRRGDQDIAFTPSGDIVMPETGEVLGSVFDAGD